MTATAVPRHLAVGPMSIGLLFLAVAPWVTGVVIAAALVILMSTGVAARRVIAFRADQAGITLGAVPGRLMVRRGTAVFIPWADAEKIILYPARPGRAGPEDRVQCVGVQQRERSAALPVGNEQAARCPVPGARCPGWWPGRLAGLPAGGWTASGSPPSQRRWRLESSLSTPARAPVWAFRGQAQGLARRSRGPQMRRVQQLSDGF